MRMNDRIFPSGSAARGLPAADAPSAVGGSVTAGAFHTAVAPLAVGTARAIGAHRAAGRRLLGAAVLGLAVLATGCASTTPAQITTFNRQDASAAGWAGQRFVIQPLAGQGDSLEYADYARRVQSALEKHGLVPVQDIGSAQLVVNFEYRSGGAVTSSRSSSSSFSVGVGGGYHTGWGLGLGLPIGGSSEDTTRYRHQLQVQMAQVMRGAQGGIPGQRVYESTLVTQGSSAAVAPLMPAMIDALFADFPGQNGKTVNVSLKP